MTAAMTIPKNGAGLAKTAAPADMSAIERVLVDGDLTPLTPDQRVAYYNRTCESLGLNPMTSPFAYLRLNNKLVLYAKRDATDQLRKIHGISIRIVGRGKDDEICIITAQASTPDGRVDESTGALHIPANLKGEGLANALMKCETKAKRRVTLSICGLGMVDESEVSSIKGARFVNVTSDGEIIDERPVEYGAAPVEYAEEVPAADPDTADRLGNAMADARTLASLKAYGLEVKKANLAPEEKARLGVIYLASEKRLKASAETA